MSKNSAVSAASSAVPQAAWLVGHIGGELWLHSGHMKNSIYKINQHVLGSVDNAINWYALYRPLLENHKWTVKCSEHDLHLLSDLIFQPIGYSENDTGRQKTPEASRFCELLIAMLKFALFFISICL